MKYTEQAIEETSITKKEKNKMSVTKEKLRQDLAECKAIRPIHAGATDWDFAFRERVNKAIALFLDWLELELAE